MHQFPIPSGTKGYSEIIAARAEIMHRLWHNYATPDDPSTARARFGRNEPFMVHSKPRFSIPDGGSVFTIGSCFARNVEQELKKCGFHVPTLDIEIPQEVYTRKSRFPNSILNKYTAHSTADDVLRALNARIYPDMGLLKVGPQNWYDPQTSMTHPLDRATAELVRGRLNELLAKLKACDVLILTLGLTETWLDAETGVIFNHLNPAVLPSLGKRMRFFNATVAQCFDALRNAMEALHRACPGMKVVVTVSPVPMERTFTSMDVVAANTYSKATLRVTAQMLCEAFDFVDYYPSFEMVMNSPRPTSWISDQIHVRADLVEWVVREFTLRYVAGASPAAAERGGAAGRPLKAGAA